VADVAQELQKSLQALPEPLRALSKLLRELSEPLALRSRVSTTVSSTVRNNRK
jgi:hypothetical protein